MARRNQRGGTVLVIVIIMLIFTATALATFLDRASNDLLVASHVKTANRLRGDAYSALETTLAVLEDFDQASNASLHAPSEGWNDPLTWAGWTPSEPGRTVDVAFVDESGKIPLIHCDQTTMLNLFEAWGLSQDDAQHLRDVLEMWIHPGYLPQIAPSPDYEQDALPYTEPLRSLRSYDELAAIDFARDTLYDANGNPNDLWWRFYNDFSLYNYTSPNINTANPEVLTALGQFTLQQEQNISDFLAGKGDFVTPNPLGVQWFTSTNQLQTVAGPGGLPNKFVTTISALRILITVHEGGSSFRLEAVVAPQGGARAVMTTATAAQQSASNAANGETQAASPLAGAYAPSDTPTSAQTSAVAAGTANLRYPFTILEIAENDQILTPPPLPPLPTTTVNPTPTAPSPSTPVPSAAPSAGGPGNAVRPL